MEGGREGGGRERTDTLETASSCSLRPAILYAMPCASEGLLS